MIPPRPDAPGRKLIERRFTPNSFRNLAKKNFRNLAKIPLPRNRKLGSKARIISYKNPSSSDL